MGLVSLARRWTPSPATASGLRGRCFRLFEQCDLGAVDGGARPTYRELARTFDLPENQVTNHLALARREFRGMCSSDCARALCGSDAEFRAEARALLGVDPG